MEIDRLRGTGSYLSTQWWSNTFRMFDLNHALSITCPSDAQDMPDDEMLEAMAAAHNENPVKASTTPLERWLHHAETLGRRATFGLLTSSVPGPDLTASNAMKIHVAIMQFWARTST